MSWMVIRVRGTIHARHDLIQTLEHLHLTRPNHATILPETANMKGMLTKVQGYVTWGEADAATVQMLLQQRGRRADGAAITEAPAADIPALTQSVTKDGLLHAPGVRPLFRLRAPKGGWRSTKKPFALGGALGYRGAAINQLAQKML